MPLNFFGPARPKAATLPLATPRTAVLQSTPAPQEPPQPDVTMTRLPSRRLLALALASAIAMPALAQTTEPAAAPVAAAPASSARGRLCAATSSASRPIASPPTAPGVSHSSALAGPKSHA